MKRILKNQHLATINSEQNLSISNILQKRITPISDILQRKKTPVTHIAKVSKTRYAKDLETMRQKAMNLFS